MLGIMKSLVPAPQPRALLTRERTVRRKVPWTIAITRFKNGTGPITEVPDHGATGWFESTALIFNGMYGEAGWYEVKAYQIAKMLKIVKPDHRLLPLVFYENSRIEARPRSPFGNNDRLRPQFNTSSTFGSTGSNSRFGRSSFL